MLQEMGQDTQHASINSCLGLLISPGDYIPNGTESWSLDRLEMRRVLTLRDTCQKVQQDPSLNA